MWIFSFYRFYFSLLIGIASYFFVIKNILICVLIIITTRILIFILETFKNKAIINRNFKKYLSDFKQQHGPYGIRIANKAENDWQTKASLSEVFTDNEQQLKKTVEQIEVMDTLFKAGMRPNGDAWLLHDLKLKYGKYRVENFDK